MRLDEELKCFSLLGFGSGYAWGRANIKPDEKIDGSYGHCVKECPEMKRCLSAHLKRTSLMYPKAAREFDRMAREMGQPQATQKWGELHPQTPIEPYALQLVINHEDGLAVAQTGKPKDRGSVTLTWPR